MRILLTNDDGFFAPGLQALYKALQSLGEVVIVAPASEQSAVGHSITLLAGVLMEINVSAYLVDAIIGLSVVYKAFDNLNGFKTLFGVQPNNKVAVGLFGLIHGFGLATKLQALNLNENGLVWNMIGFNIGVELGQIFALSIILALMVLCRKTASFNRLAAATNVLIMIAGFMLMEYQLAGYFLGLPVI